MRLALATKVVSPHVCFGVYFIYTDSVFYILSFPPEHYLKSVGSFRWGEGGLRTEARGSARPMRPQHGDRGVGETTTRIKAERA